MDIPGLVQSYGTGNAQTNASSQATASTSYSRSLAITSYAAPTQYASASAQMAPQHQLHNPFGYNNYHTAPNRIVPTLHNPYSQPRPQSQQYSPQTPMASNSISSHSQSYLRSPPQLSHPRYDSLQSPSGYMVKPESQTSYMNTSTGLSWNQNGQTSPYSPNQVSMYHAVSGQSQASPISASGSISGSSPKFGTDVDTLMQAIQSKPQVKEVESKVIKSQKGASSSQSRGDDDGRSTV